MLLAFLAFTRAFVKAAPGRGGWLVTQPRIRPRRLFRPEATMATRERKRERGRERDTPGEKVYYRPGEVACFSILPLLSLSLALSTSVKGRLSQVPRIRSLISLKVYRWNERIVSNSSWISRRSYEEEMHVYLEKG